jgi:hypothetical protein
MFDPFKNNLYCNEIEKQIIACIHRIGRTKAVSNNHHKPSVVLIDIYRILTIDVYILITKNTIE